ncbi:MAG: hypothetical protein WD077_15360 [Bacteroidia bacterium]
MKKKIQIVRYFIGTVERNIGLFPHLGAPTNIIVIPPSIPDIGLLIFMVHFSTLAQAGHLLMC